MSDFVFSSVRKLPGELSAAMIAIYVENPPAVREFHGEWGSLAVSQNMYPNFQVVEDESSVFCILGGPVILYHDNAFLGGDDPTRGTALIRERFMAGNLRFEEDLSGPYVIVSLDKAESTLTVVTDIMLFLPVYMSEGDGEVMLASHVDVLAVVSGQVNSLDEASLVDFVLNDVITYPFTAYTSLRQCPPATVLRFKVRNEKVLRSDTLEYWRPNEVISYGCLEEAARALRDSVNDYVSRVTSGLDHVAQFLSGGEDSRAIAGLLPAHLKRDGFVFVETRNREARISEKVAQAHGVNLHVHLRSVSHYADVLPGASRLTGLGHQYCHAHSMGIHAQCRLADYRAVFGGFLSDSFIKGYYTRKVRRISRMHFLPQFFIKGETRTRELVNPAFNPELIRIVTDRRREHFARVHEIRKRTAHEWFTLWPATMRATVPNIYINRRLFRSYEPFLGSGVVRISAGVPIEWKLNRRLFNKAMQPFLWQSRFIVHGDGWFPYYPWWVNTIPRQLISWSRKIGRKTGRIKGNQASWTDWKKLVNSEKWMEMYNNNKGYVDSFRNCFAKFDQNQEIEYKKFSIDQKMNLLQILVSVEQLSRRAGSDR